MSTQPLPTPVDELGPIDYLVIQFPTRKPTGEGLALLVDLVERGLIRVLDLMFVRKDEQGTSVVVAPEEISSETFDLSVFQGASSGLVTGEDLAAVEEVIDPGSTAVVLLYENSWAAPLAVAVRRGGGQLVANGRIPVQALLAALEETESEELAAKS